MLSNLKLYLKSLEKKDWIIIFIIIYIIYLHKRIKLTEKNTNIVESVEDTVRELYQIDLKRMKEVENLLNNNLATIKETNELVKKLNSGGDITLPGNLNVGGNLTVNGNTDCKKMTRIDSLSIPGWIYFTEKDTWANWKNKTIISAIQPKYDGINIKNNSNSGLGNFNCNDLKAEGGNIYVGTGEQLLIHKSSTGGHGHITLNTSDKWDNGFEIKSEGVNVKKNFTACDGLAQMKIYDKNYNKPTGYREAYLRLNAKKTTGTETEPVNTEYYGIELGTNGTTNYLRSYKEGSINNQDENRVGILKLEGNLTTTGTATINGKLVS